MPIYDNNSPDIDIGFKATLSFVLAIAAFGFGTLASLALETPIGILFALTAGLLLALLPFMAGWIQFSPISDEVNEAMEMGRFTDEATVPGEGMANRPIPRPGEEPVRNAPDERHP